MAQSPNEQDIDDHTKIILKRYEDRANVTYNPVPTDILIHNYLAPVASPDFFRDKVILEVGAGCSSYIPLFLQSGCKRYYANDIIPERLAASRVDDPRYHELPGDFRTIDIPEQPDIIFANLVRMFLIPFLDEIVARFARILKPGGVFFSYDPNYFCPLSMYRRFADRKANPVRLFSPFRYANTFRRHGFEIEKLVPLTAKYPWTVGNWLLGTSFWLRARKK